MNEKLMHLFRFAYLIWTFFYVVIVIEGFIGNNSIKIVDIVNAVFLSYGIYYMFKYHSK